MALAGKNRASPKYSRPLAEIVNRALDPLVVKQGFAESSLILQWEAIMGARVAGVSQPIRLQWPPRLKKADDKTQQPATLLLRVEPGFGLDIQHMSGAIVDRVNAHMGWRCVARLAIRQEPLAAPKRRPARRLAVDPAAHEQARLAAAGVADDALHAALVRLGEQVLARRGP